MKLHSGYIESCHAPYKDISWYLEHKHDPNFCDSLKNGSFTPCGNSGDTLFVLKFVKGEIVFEPGLQAPSRTRCCCFVFGKSCDEDHLRRRWSCCGQELSSATIYEMCQLPCRKPKYIRFFYTKTKKI